MKNVSIPDIEQAITTVESSRQTHIEWRDYWLSLLPHKPDNCDECLPKMVNAGGLAHQEKCIADYDQVLTVLRTYLAESRKSEEPKACTYYQGCTGPRGACGYCAIHCLCDALSKIGESVETCNEDHCPETPRDCGYCKYHCGCRSNS